MKTKNNFKKLHSIITIIIILEFFLTACANNESQQFKSDSTENTSQNVEITKCHYSLGDGVTLFWNVYPEADGYNVCRGDSNSADEVIMVIDNIDGQHSYTYKDTSFDYSKHDFYCVTAFSKNAEGKVEEIAKSRIVSIKSEFGEQGDGEVFDYSTAMVIEGSNNSVTIEDGNGNFLEERSEINVDIDPSRFYITNHQCFYARAIKGMDSQGNYLLGDWECILNDTSGAKKFILNGKYAELGFEFNIVYGTDWPYSDVFWHLQDGVAEDILIEYGGTAKAAWIKIYVNGSIVVYDSYCESHERYDWDC